MKKLLALVVGILILYISFMAFRPKKITKQIKISEKETIDLIQAFLTNINENNNKNPLLFNFEKDTNINNQINNIYNYRNGFKTEYLLKSIKIKNITYLLETEEKDSVYSCSYEILESVKVPDTCDMVKTIETLNILYNKNYLPSNITYSSNLNKIERIKKQTEFYQNIKDPLGVLPSIYYELDSLHNIKGESKQNIILLKKENGWKIIPYDYQNINFLIENFSVSLLTKALGLSGLELNPEKIERTLDNIGKEVFNSINTNNYFKLYSMYGANDFVCQYIPSFSIKRLSSNNKTKKSYLEGLNYKKETIKEDIYSLYRKYKVDNVKLIDLHKVYFSNKSGDFCSLLIEIESKRSTHDFIEVECAQTDIGWIIIDDINPQSYRKEVLDYIKHLKN